MDNNDTSINHLETTLMKTKIPYTRFQDYRWKDIKKNLMEFSILAAKQMSLFHLACEHVLTEEESKGFFDSTLVLLNEKKRVASVMAAKPEFLDVLELAEEFWLGLGKAALHDILVKGLASLLKPAKTKPSKPMNEQNAQKLYTKVMSHQLSEYRYKLDALFYSECTAKDMSKNLMQSLALVQEYYHLVLGIREKLLVQEPLFTYKELKIIRFCIDADSEAQLTEWERDKAKKLFFDQKSVCKLILQLDVVDAELAQRSESRLVKNSDITTEDAVRKRLNKIDLDGSSEVAYISGFVGHEREPDEEGSLELLVDFFEQTNEICMATIEHEDMKSDLDITPVQSSDDLIEPSFCISPDSNMSEVEGKVFKASQVATQNAVKHCAEYLGEQGVLIAACRQLKLDCDNAVIEQLLIDFMGKAINDWRDLPISKIKKVVGDSLSNYRFEQKVETAIENFKQCVISFLTHAKHIQK